jgi:ABC-type uncharacterized transport system ATPase subunit
MIDISKHFGRVHALDGVHIDIYPGEVLGIMGENGAGKTTLMNILYGLYQSDEGRILIDDKHIQIHSPRDAISNGLGMVHQHFMLVHSFSVRENVALGLNQHKTPFLELDAVEARINQLADTYAMHVETRAKVRQLSVGEQQRVEILNALAREARVLILDEPTAVLTPQETDVLLASLRILTEKQKSVVFITHKLEEAMRITDRIAVLRRGRLVGITKTSDTNRRDLANMMIGREVFFSYERKTRRKGGELFSVEGLWVNDDRGLSAVKGVKFSIGKGEILGLAGVDGNGQRELCEALAGLRPIKTGKVTINGEPYSELRSRKATLAGVGYIPEDRQRTGLVLGFPIWRNAVLKRYFEKKFAKGIFMRFGIMFAFTRNLIEEYSIRVPDEQALAETLSGGNQQRLVLARELSAEPMILIANQPTRGLDIAATEYMHLKLLHQRDEGKAILLVSRELTEILLLSDRVGVMYEGQILDIIPAEHAERESIGLLMSGQMAK